ncbi:MAG TPA: hypothetical protein VFX37_15475 [Pseudolabrys sp.]|nr:hypothetical protein [Pseudolabrys sp.]
MSRFRRYGLPLLVVLAASAASPVAAQENVEAGKTPAQLYASDCAICHKSPQGLTKAGGLFGLAGFLREHYTASRETAQVIANYLKSVDRSTPPAARQRTASRHRKEGSKPEGNKDKSTTETGKPAKKKSSSAKATVEGASEEKTAGGASTGGSAMAKKPAATEPAKPATSN